MIPKTVIIIAGPTAAGKTAVAIELAKHFGTEIISADSRQCYKEMSIGVARPSPVELAVVPHHFIATHSIQDKITAATFEDYALQKAAGLFHQHDIVVMVGGTGLYIKAFCEGLDFIPPVPDEVRNEIILYYEHYGLGWLQTEVQKADPDFFATGEIYNPQRLMRALEVIKATGQSILHYRKANVIQRSFRIIKLAIDLPKEALHQRIHQRVDNMIENGLVEEVRSLLPYRHLPALQTVGYRELFDFFDGKDSLGQSIEKIKTATRQYAKRQLTWFKKDKTCIWLPPRPQTILQELGNLL